MTTTAEDFGIDIDVDPPDNPLVDGDKEYSVRLIFKVNADNPEHARTRFIAVLNEHGMNAWTYRVTDVETDEDFMVQDGAVLTPAAYVEAVENEDEDEDDTEALDDDDTEA